MNECISGLFAQSIFKVTVILFFLIAFYTSAAEVDFEKSILPILSENCFSCHGPDSNDRKANLRLDTFDGAIAAGESGKPAIVPRDSSRGSLIERIYSKDIDELMPPQKSDKTLSLPEKEILKQWIEQGAKYSEHWAYQPIQSHKPTPTIDRSWSKNALDNFVLSRLENQRIRPSKEADRYTLIKRLYYDILGLLPTRSEVEHFVKDKSPLAYESLVDQLLSSEHFGERWARHWLDKARYADSDGYEKDNARPNAWRYRDWVIQAINADMPFDQFTVEQLAGDLLPNASDEHLLATAFNRQTLTNTEGGTDREQWRVAAVMDRTETVGAVWLGLTVGCARCHTHKYDQITHQEYYQLYAFFNNGDEAQTKVPRSKRALTEYQSAKTTHQNALTHLKQQLREEAKSLESERDLWLANARAQLKESQSTPLQYHPFSELHISGNKGSLFSKQSDGSYLVSGKKPKNENYTIQINNLPETLSGIRLEALPHESLPAKGPGSHGNGNFVLTRITVSNSTSPETPIKISRATADFSQENWPVQGAIDGDPKTGWAVSPQLGKEHHANFFFEAPIKPKAGESLSITLFHEYKSGAHNIGHFRLQAIEGAASPNYSNPVLAALGKPDTDLSSKEQEVLIDEFANTSPKLQALREDIATTKTSEPSSPLMDVRVIKERTDAPRKTRILERGEFTRPLETVYPDGLGVLPSLNANEKGQAPNRLDLATWLVSPENPLVPRVSVNQIWSHLFGTGLVKTVNDFGVRGERPSHPRLLDHLAGQFIQQGWSRKNLIKYIALSATYRQASNYRPDLETIDPENRLLYRQNRFRVEAETIRDLSLDAGGLLSHKIGGPSVFPPTSPDVVALTYNSSVRWNESPGGDRYRRGMYTFFKRTAPHPTLVTFDCPDSNLTCVERVRSNTPLGALTLLNNQVFHEAAQSFAKRVLKLDALSDRHRLAQAFQIAAIRPVEEEELSALETLLQASRSWYLTNPDSAKELSGDTNGTVAQAGEVAAWIATLRIVLNLDEFVTRS